MGEFSPFWYAVADARSFCSVAWNSDDFTSALSRSSVFVVLLLWLLVLCGRGYRSVWTRFEEPVNSHVLSWQMAIREPAGWRNQRSQHTLISIVPLGGNRDHKGNYLHVYKIHRLSCANSTLAHTRAIPTRIHTYTRAYFHTYTSPRRPPVVFPIRNGPFSSPWPLKDRIYSI